MLIRTGFLCIALALAAPGWVLAKASAPAEPPVADFDEDLLAREAIDAASQEVSEVVTTEEIQLPPVQDQPRPQKGGMLIEEFGLRTSLPFESEWAAFWRLAGYNPTANEPSGGALASSIGLRYKLPDRHGEYFQLGYEASYGFWNGSTADVQMVELAIEAFAAGSPAFRLKHHPYYGIGIGNAEVNRRGAGTFNQNVFTVFGGVEFPGRRVDFDVFAKYIYGPDSRFNLDDLQVGLGMVYTFGRGR